MAMATISPLAAPTMKGVAPSDPTSVFPATMASRMSFPEDIRRTSTLPPALAKSFSSSAAMAGAPQRVAW